MAHTQRTGSFLAAIQCNGIDLALDLNGGVRASATNGGQGEQIRHFLRVLGISLVDVDRLFGLRVFNDDVGVVLLVFLE